MLNVKSSAGRLVQNLAMAHRMGKQPAPAAVEGDLYDQPGHLIRRAHQIAQGMFDEHVGRAVTPIQYAILRLVQEAPGIDQVGLARRIALDTSTTATAAARLESKGLLTRAPVAGNRRQLQLHLSATGQALLSGLVDGVHRQRTELLSALTPAEQTRFIALLKKFVHLNNEQSRAPLRLAMPPEAASKPPPRTRARR